MVAAQGHALAGAVPEQAGPFAFVGGALALDLVNTELVIRGKRRDLLSQPGAVGDWWRAARRYYPNDLAAEDEPNAGDAALLPALLQLRSALRGLFGALADGAAPAAEHVATLNAVLAASCPALVVDPSGAASRVERARDVDVAPIVPIALSALRLATEGDRARLHRCANERCVLLFYDTTKSATRRWCSVACKDRDRKLRGYRRARATERRSDGSPSGA